MAMPDDDLDDPLAGLREGLDDEPLVPASKVASMTTPSPAASRAAPSSASVPTTAPFGGPPVGPPGAGAPPPLPRRPTTIPPPVVRPPAQSSAAAVAVIPLPPQPARPTGNDAFSEPPEPRPPKGGPEEKLDYFRQILRLKSETLTRARTLYAERDQEALALREAGTQLQKALEDALGQLNKLRDLPMRLEAERSATETEKNRADHTAARLAELERHQRETEADRRDLSRALAEVESQVPNLTTQLEEERAARASIAEELVGAKEALQLAQERLAELASSQSESQGNLEALNEQYQTVAAENARLEQERELAVEEARTAAAERDAALAERDAAREEPAALQSQLHSLREALEESRGKFESSQKDKADFQALKMKLQAAEERTHQALTQAHEARQRLEALSAEHKSALANTKKGEGERQNFEKQLAALQAKLKATEAEAEERVTALEKEYTQQAKRLKTASDELAKEREKGQAASDAKGNVQAKVEELVRIRESLKQELLLAQAAAEEKAGEAAHAVEELERLRNSPEGPAMVKKLREELVVANKKAMDATVALQRERKVKEQVTDVNHSSLEPQASSPELESVKAERESLRNEVIALKKKLVAGEAAREAAASLKAKVAKLEAQLKTKG